MPKLNLTVDEWVAMLSHTELPTVIVEGRDDMRIYRWVEGRISNQKVGVQAVGGRGNLLSIYKRRNEYAHLPVAFVADKDLWLFSGIPPDYPDVIWTQGYSIENDLYADANLERMLNAEQMEPHRQVLDSIIEWYAFEVGEHLAKKPAKVATNCDIVVPVGQTKMDKGFRKSRGFRSPNEKLHQEIKEAYQLKLRGKSLMQILLRFLNTPNHGKYDDVTLHEIAVKMADSYELMDRLIGEIERAIAEHTPPN